MLVILKDAIEEDQGSPVHHSMWNMTTMAQRDRYPLKL